MILFFSGVFATVGLLAMLGAGYMLGQKKSPKPMIDEDEEQRRKQIRIRKAFDNLMSYDVDKAMERKVN